MVGSWVATSPVLPSSSGCRADFCSERSAYFLLCEAVAADGRSALASVPATSSRRSPMFWNLCRGMLLAYGEIGRGSFGSPS
jgi:hypothetical protein